MSLKTGQKYEVLKPFQCLCLYGYQAPFTGGGEIAVAEGFQFKVMLDVNPAATAANCHPLDYEKHHEEFVPEEIRADDKYDGYGLMIKLDDISRFCRPL